MSWSRAIAHVDLDAFFASVEQLDNPSLVGQPVLVGGRGPRAVVAAASYEARRFGCHSAQPMSQALRRCPQAVVCAPRMTRYTAVSRAFFLLLSRFSPLVQGLSIDEGFVDLSGTERLLGPIEQAPAQIRQLVHKELGLSCSVGLASNKFLAKMASESAKPAGISMIEPGRELDFLQPLDVSSLWGVGKKTARTLHQMGLYRVGDIAQCSVQKLSSQLGSLGLHLHALSRGDDPREVIPHSKRKQIGIERTFDVDIRDPLDIQQRLLGYANDLADQLVAKGLRARKVQIKLRSTDFKTITRQRTLDLPSFDATTLYQAGWAEYLRSDWMGSPLRLLGLSVGELGPEHQLDEAPKQLSLLNDPAEALALDARRQAENRQKLISTIRERFGGQSMFLGGSTQTPRQDTGVEEKE